MATVNTARASYSKPNPNLLCGKKDTLTPTVTRQETFLYTVSANGITKTVPTISEVNALLRRYPTARVVKTIRETTIRTTHKRIR